MLLHMGWFGDTIVLNHLKWAERIWFSSSISSVCKVILNSFLDPHQWAGKNPHLSIFWLSALFLFSLRCLLLSFHLSHCLVSSARSTPQEAGGWGLKFHRHPRYLEAPSADKAARPNQRLPGHLFPTWKWGTARPAKHLGCCFARSAGTRWCLPLFSGVSLSFLNCDYPVQTSYNFHSLLSSYCLTSHFVSLLFGDTLRTFFLSTPVSSLSLFSKSFSTCDIWL